MTFEAQGIFKNPQIRFKSETVKLVWLVRSTSNPFIPFSLLRSCLVHLLRPAVCDRLVRGHPFPRLRILPAISATSATTTLYAPWHRRTRRPDLSVWAFVQNPYFSGSGGLTTPAMWPEAAKVNVTGPP